MSAHEKVPFAPFQAWLQERLKHYNRLPEAGASATGRLLNKDKGRGLQLLANATGLSQRLLFSYLRGGADAGHGYGWRPFEHIELDTVDRALVNEGSTNLWELYPDFEGEDVAYDERWCPRCAEQVTVGADELCPWCETPTGKPRVHVAPPRLVPEAVQPRRRVKRRKVKSRVVRKPVVGRAGFVPEPKPEPELRARTRPRKPGPGTGRATRLTPDVLHAALERYVAGADMTAIATELHGPPWSTPDSLAQALGRQFALQGWKGPVGRGPHGRAVTRPTAKAAEDLEAFERGERKPEIVRPIQVRKPKPLDTPRGLTERLMWEAAWLYYYDELGFVKVAERLLPRTRYKTARSLGGSIFEQFQRRGWPTRDRIDATRAASWKHGLGGRDRREKGTEGMYRRWRKARDGDRRPRCKGIVKGVKNGRQGERCVNPAEHGSEYCWAHHPERQELHRETLKAARERMRDRNWVPAAPFVAWLARLEEQVGTRRRLAEQTGVHATILTRWLGTSPRLRNRSRAPRPPAEFVRATSVVRVLAAVNDGTTFEDLYDVVTEQLEEAA